MPSPTAPRPRQPSWRHLGGGAFALFVVIVAFLAGRVRAGTDPGVARATSSRPAPAATQPASPDQGLDDGSALPQDQGGTDPGFDDGSGAVAPDPDPPTTHAS